MATTPTRARKRDLAFAAGRSICTEVPRMLFVVAACILVLQFFGGGGASVAQIRGGGVSGSGSGGSSGAVAGGMSGIAGFTKEAMGVAARAAKAAKDAVARAPSLAGSAWAAKHSSGGAECPSCPTCAAAANSGNFLSSLACPPCTISTSGGGTVVSSASTTTSSPSSVDGSAFPPGCIVVIFGTRPEAVKLLPVLSALRLLAGDTRAIVAVNTGQHDALLHKTLESLGDGGGGGTATLVDLDLNLGGGGGGSPAGTIATLLSALSPAFAASPPALVVVQGDTTTAAAAAVAAHLSGVPVAHVEAGLRSFSGVTPFPEEFYRTTIAAASVLHFAPTHHAARSLAAQGNVRGRVHVVGNPGVDGTRAQLTRLASLGDTAAPAPTLTSSLTGSSLVPRLAFVPELALVALAALNGNVPIGNSYWSDIENTPLPVYAKLCNPWCAAGTGVTALPSCLQRDIQTRVAAATDKNLIGDVWIVLTMHRRESFGAPFERLARAIGDLVDDFYPNLHVVWPMHPNPAVAAGMREGLKGLGEAHVDAPGAAGASHAHGGAGETSSPASVLPTDASDRSKHLRANLHVLEPLPADEVTALLLAADVVVTDSGGLQEEAVTLGKHVFVLRETTERPEALASGLMHLVGTDASILRTQLETWIDARCEPDTQVGARASRTYGDGKSGARIAELMLAVLSATEHGSPGALVPDGSYADPRFAAAATAATRPTSALNAATSDFQKVDHGAFADQVAKEAAEASSPLPPTESGLDTVTPDDIAAAQAAQEVLDAVVEEEEEGGEVIEEEEEEGSDEGVEEEEGEGEEEVTGGADEVDESVPSLEVEAGAAATGRRLIETKAESRDSSSGTSSSGNGNLFPQIFGEKGLAGVLGIGARIVGGSDGVVDNVGSGGGGGGGGGEFISRLLASTSSQAVPLAHERFLRPLQCSAQPPDTGIAAKDSKEDLFGDVMAAESDYNLDDAIVDPAIGEYTWTAILGTYRRMKYLARTINALLDQAHPPVEVWVTSFASPHLAELESITKSFQLNGSVKVKWIGGDPQLKYFGRFQIAAQASTTHVAFFDDDCIPGSNAVTNAFHMMYLKSKRYYGLIGMKGHWAPVEEEVTHIQRPYHVTWEYRPPMAKEVDLTGGMWFLRRDWIHIMFRDNAFTLETGEDFQLTYSLKKYMGKCGAASS